MVPTATVALLLAFAASLAVALCLVLTRGGLGSGSVRGRAKCSLQSVISASSPRSIDR